MNDIPAIEIDKLYDRLQKEAAAGGYYLNPDVEFVKLLIAGILTNEKRYGYWSCPCRLASGNREEDLDMVCPCDYRDQDLLDYGTCYCALYVSSAVFRGEQPVHSIPDRRPPAADRAKAKAIKQPEANIGSLPLPVWRCKVCGYLCARERPPEVCPVCKAKADRFERFL